MRLSAEQVKRGILHPDDKHVRFAALRYFSESRSSDASVMPVVIEAIERFGRAEAFSYTFPIANLAQTTETCWRELEQICEQGKGKTYAGDFPYARAEEIVEALGRRDEEQARRMWPLLTQRVEDYRDDPMAWMEPLMVQLAGELRYEPAIPVIVEKLYEDAEVLSEACIEALAAIGTDAAVEAVREAYPTAPWHFRLYASGVLGHIHSDRAVDAGIELLDQEQDGDLRNSLAQSLVEQFSYQGNEAARRVLLDDPDQFDLMRALVTACTLMEQDFPELTQWRAAIAERTRSKQRRLALPPAAARRPADDDRAHATSPATQPTQTERKVGRNDPCPCGSGKKYNEVLSDE